MGALTFKPLAYRSRPWELTRVDTFNHFEGTGVLTLHLRGGRVLGVSQPGWMRDRVRFLHDGLRRQRLTSPHGGGQPIGWPVALTLFLSLLGGRNFTFKVDPGGVHFYWLLRGYNTLRDARGPTRVVSLDSNFEGTPYHGAFGLRAAGRAGLALPGCLTHEEEGFLTPPAGGVSLFLTGGILPQVLRPAPRGDYRWGGLVTPGESHPRGPTRALFQVSPLQGLLPRW